MKKWFLSLLLVLAMALPVGATVVGPPEQIYAFSPPPAQYVVIGDLFNKGCLIFEADLMTPLPAFSTHERDGLVGTTVLQPRIQWLVKGSKVKVYRVNAAEEATLTAMGFTLPPKPDFDMPDRLFVEFCLFLSSKPNPKGEDPIDFFQYSFFAGTIQGDRNEKGGAENYRFFGIGGALSRPYPLTFTAGGYVVDKIINHDVRACSAFETKVTACAKGWDEIVHPEHSSCEGCSGLDKWAIDIVKKYETDDPNVKIYKGCGGTNYWDIIPNDNTDISGTFLGLSGDTWQFDGTAGSCVKVKNISAEPPYPVGFIKASNYDSGWDILCGWNWPVIEYETESVCTAYQGEILYSWSEYTWKWVEVDDNNVQISTLLDSAYMSVQGAGLIFYGLRLEDGALVWNDPTTKVWGKIKGVVPGEYTFTIPFLTKGRAPTKELWAD